MCDDPPSGRLAPSASQEEDSIMRGPSRIIVLPALLFLGLLVGSWGPFGTRAQNVTPAPSRAEEDVTFDLIGYAQGAALPNPADLFALRLDLGPGGVSPISGANRAGAMLIVETGAITVNVEAPWTVNRKANLATAMATAEADGDASAAVAPVAANEDVILTAGDAAYIPGSVAGEIRNDGQERAVVLAFLVGPSSGAGEATPAP
jgi:hypothetical protein